MRKDLTAIYYSSNKELPEFEKKITDGILKVTKNLPIISVTQKPMDFGTNICVGDVGCSDSNIYRQIQIALEKVTTKYVCTLESDCLYPPTGYFDFVPPDDKIAYYYTNVWILYKNSDVFKKKNYSLCALFSNREYLIWRISRILAHRPMWYPSSDRKNMRPILWKKIGWLPIESEIPCVNIKTGQGLRWKTGTTDEKTTELPYFGTVDEVKQKLWHK